MYLQCTQLGLQQLRDIGKGVLRYKTIDIYVICIY
jgi:hypothetical protein